MVHPQRPERPAPALVRGLDRCFTVAKACGWPEKAVVFVQSQVPQTAELALVFGMFTPLGWLERVPTYKEQLQELREKDLGTYGFLGYPVLMTADIIMYKATRVPVGADQVAHLELTREIARKFNYHYGPVFPEPQPLLTEAAKVVGTDGRKMSKSYGNTIEIFGEEKAVRKKIMGIKMDSRTPQEPVTSGTPAVSQSSVIATASA